MATLDTELRKLRPGELFGLAEALSLADSWKILMDKIPKPGEDRNSHLFTSKHISMVEVAAVKQKRSAAEIFLVEWGTWGRRRPTLGVVIELLIEAQLFRAGDYLAVNILKGTPLERPKRGPAAVVNIPDLEDSSAQMDELAHPVITNFCDRSTADIDIGNITYPSGIFSSSTAPDSSSPSQLDSSENHDRFIDIHFSEPRNTENRDQVVQMERSDLMKFSESLPPDEIEEISRDLIEFSASGKSCRGETEKSEIEKSLGIILPNLAALALDRQERLPETPPEIEFLRELGSYELPRCINTESTSEWDSESSSDTTFPSHSVVSSDQSSIQTEDSVAKGLPRILSIYNKQLKSECKSEKESPLNPLNTQELPATVVELFGKRQDKQDLD